MLLDPSRDFPTSSPAESRIGYYFPLPCHGALIIVAIVPVLRDRSQCDFNLDFSFCPWAFVRIPIAECLAAAEYHQTLAAGPSNGSTWSRHCV
ncbi:hypothetical protein HDV57DRAFT_467964 [Trichoderma longibrachiatum]|uniref:Uncharacterized protein n=1 Tax=Trichoderma longibrachiatum ATCC 18648 TaxID=983965 RepID=A0A2T4C5Q2_TRILO|nr:hypothetical protein M440DRAFT_305920 [Trichoderma longibrachiatum ATCC 18648]